MTNDLPKQVPTQQDNRRAFQPGRIGSLTVKNRLVRSATAETTNTDNGEITDATIALYRGLASGGVGLIITGHTAVHRQGLARADMTRVHDDSLIPGLRRLSRAVHTEDKECRILLQLSHPGRQISEHSPSQPVAPSSVLSDRLRALKYQPPRALTIDEIEELIESFVSAVARAQAAGFDGVQLHAAHGWLLSTFLSPNLNHRHDRFGGSLENNARMLTEIITQSRRQSGDFPILVKMNSDDLVPEGLKPETASKTARLLEKAGCDGIEISGGNWEAMAMSREELGFAPVPIPEARTGIETEAQEAYFYPNAGLFRRETRLPLILVGGIKSFGRVEKILAEGSVDFCALCRPLIRQPDLPDLWRRRVSRRSDCRSCNGCLHASPRRCVQI
jgi:2,4-dienoyl-CoA reductase-like NADH-dependent reductase (Old Yellow Enzyme family)